MLEVCVDPLQFFACVHLVDVFLLSADEVLLCCELHLQMLLVVQDTLELVELFVCLLVLRVLRNELTNHDLIFFGWLLDPLFVLFLDDIVILFDQILKLETPELIHLAERVLCFSLLSR